MISVNHVTRFLFLLWDFLVNLYSFIYVHSIFVNNVWIKKEKLDVFKRTHMRVSVSEDTNLLVYT